MFKASWQLSQLFYLLVFSPELLILLLPHGDQGSKVKGELDGEEGTGR